jgi:hypothetical protein
VSAREGRRAQEEIRGRELRPALASLVLSQARLVRTDGRFSYKPT